MDTDDLSEEAYAAVLIESEKFHHDLTLQFGLLADGSKNENDYLDRCKKAIEEMRQFDQIDMEDVFFDRVPTVAQLRAALNRVSKNIDKVLAIPLKKRTFDFD